MGNNLKGKVAFITGAAHGQGRATALALASEGVRIVALDVAKPLDYPAYTLGSADDLQTLKVECEKRGSLTLTFAADVRDAKAVSHVVAEVIKT